MHSSGGWNFRLPHEVYLLTFVQAGKVYNARNRPNLDKELYAPTAITPDEKGRTIISAIGSTFNYGRDIAPARLA